VVTPRKPSAKRGRPPLAWADDPDRHAVAFLAALDALEATNLTESSLLASVLMLGKRVDDISSDALHPGMIGEAYEKVFGAGESATTFEGRASSLRQKYRAAEGDPKAAKWLIVMASIFMLLIGAKDREQVKHEALRLAADIGEEGFVRAFLEKLQPSVCPDISSDKLSQ
jgi:hypothetical protein